jgi:hypothetical protein
MSQKMQSINKQIIDNVQYKISRNIPTNEAQGECNGKLHSDQMVFVVVKQEGWTVGVVAKDAQMKVGK